MTKAWAGFSGLTSGVFAPSFTNLVLQVAGEGLAAAPSNEQELGAGCN